MAEITVRSFNHTSFTVASLDRIIPFFRDCLGFELLSRAPRASGLIERMTGIPGVAVEIAFVQGPGHKVELVEYSGPPDREAFEPRFCDSGSAHLAFDVDDADAAVVAAQRYGFALSGEVITIDAGPNRGRKVVYLQHPDGVTIEFIGPLPASGSSSEE